MNCLFPLGRAGWLIGSQVESHPWPAVRKLNSHQQNKQQKDPGSGPGVPALPEMTTSPSSPSSWSSNGLSLQVLASIILPPPTSIN
ncbi:hypothetical protein ACLKA7_012201 [Drosophila subpalustris]